MKNYFLLVTLALGLSSQFTFADNELEAFRADYRVIANHVPTGMTATTTLASMVDYVNRSRQGG